MKKDLEQQHVQNVRIHEECFTQRAAMATQRDAMKDQQRAPNKPPKDPNQLAKYILDVTTGESEKIEPPKKNPHAQALSKLGASKGGKARAAKLSAIKRKEIAKKAARSRWTKP